MPEFNPRRKKKVYTFGRSQPQQVVRSGEEYFDLARTEQAYPFYGLFGPNAAFPTGSAIVVTGEYDESTITFANTDTGTITFNVTFTSAPVVAVSLIPNGNGLENVVATISSVTTTGCNVSLSAPFGGKLLYRAIYAAVYPAIVERVTASASFYYTASAGTSDLSIGDNFLASYTSLGATPTDMFITVEDRNVSGDAVVAVVETGSYGLTSTQVSLSAPITDRVHYIVVK